MGLLEAIVGATVTLVGGYLLNRKWERDRKVLEEKYERYERLISFLRLGFGDSRASDAEKTKAKEDYYRETYLVWLYAPDSVIEAINSFALAFARFVADQTWENNQASNSLASELVCAMRKDLMGEGFFLPRTKLKASDFVTTTVWDVLPGGPTS